MSQAIGREVIQLRYMCKQITEPVMGDFIVLPKDLIKEFESFLSVVLHEKYPGLYGKERKCELEKITLHFSGSVLPSDSLRLMVESEEVEEK